MCWIDHLHLVHMDYRADRPLKLSRGFASVESISLVSLVKRAYASRSREQTMRMRSRQAWLSYAFAVAASALLLCFSCSRTHTVSIAVIPQTTATPISESEHLGAHTAALKSQVRLYWNAPTSEDDIQGQISLISKQMNNGYDGLILTPDSATALTAPVQRLLDRNVPVVVVGSRLSAPPSANLCYLLNDEAVGSRMAARRIATLLHGKGTVALLGVNPDVSAIVERARRLVEALHASSPGIRLIDLFEGNFDENHERQVALRFFDEQRHADAIVALSSATTHGLLAAMGQRGINPQSVHIFAFDRDDDKELLFDSPSIDSVVMVDAQRAGEEAIQQILDRLNGKPMCSVKLFPPLLLTRENVDEGMHHLRSDLDTMSPSEQARWMVDR